MKVLKKENSGHFEDHLVIEPKLAWGRILFNEVWYHKELLYFLTWSHIKGRYKQTVIGIAWATLRPVLTMAIFSLLFGKLARVSSEGVPYPLFVYAGLLPWQCFIHSVNLSMDSITRNSDLIKKVYFPRLFLPASAALSALVDFFISFGVFFILMIYYKWMPARSIILLPALVILLTIFITAVGFILSALNAFFRDVELATPFFLQIALFLTPVIYPVSIVSAKWKWLVYLNPLAGLIESFRACLLGYKPLPWGGLVLAAVLILGLFVCGLIFFIKSEETFPDII